MANVIFRAFPALSSIAERFSFCFAVMPSEWIVPATGSPVRASSVVVFDCRMIDTKTAGSHDVVFGAVEVVRVGHAEAALVYHNRAYKQV